MSDYDYMQLALMQAKKAAELGEIPIGAVLVHDEQVIAAAHNQREMLPDATAHAEILVIREGCAKLGRWRLSGCTLYVTVAAVPLSTAVLTGLFMAVPMSKLAA